MLDQAGLTNALIARSNENHFGATRRKEQGFSSLMIRKGVRLQDRVCGGSSDG
jgi:hypothetical protein